MCTFEGGGVRVESGSGSLNGGDANFAAANGLMTGGNIDVIIGDGYVTGGSFLVKGGGSSDLLGIAGDVSLETGRSYRAKSRSRRCA